MFNLQLCSELFISRPSFWLFSVPLHFVHPLCCHLWRNSRVFPLKTVTLYSHGHASPSAFIRLEAPLEHSPGFNYIGASDTVKRQRSRLFVNPLFSRLKAHNCIWWRGPATKPFSLGNVPENCLSLNIYFFPFFFTLWTRLLEDPVDDCYHPEPHSLSSSTTTS